MLVEFYRIPISFIPNYEKLKNLILAYKIKQFIRFIFSNSLSRYSASLYLSYIELEKTQI